MASESSNLEERLKSLIHQLQVESGILDKIVYKGKNQHRRCLYFQYLLKVRRDVRLLLSGHLEQILNFLLQVISGQKPANMLRLLESTNKRKFDGARHNYQERLLGMARLLSQKAPEIGELVLFSDGNKLGHKVVLNFSRSISSHEIGVTQKYNVTMDYPLIVEINRLTGGIRMTKYGTLAKIYFDELETTPKITMSKS